MKKLISFVLFVFITLSGQTQVKPGNTNPLFRQLAESKPDTNRIEILIQLARYYFNEGRLINHMDSVEFYLQQARRLNEQFSITNFQNQINILFAKRSCQQHSDMDAKKAFLPVIDICKKTKDTLNEAQAWIEMAGQIGTGLELAPFKITCYQNAMDLARQRHDKTAEMDMLRNIADVQIQLHMFDLAESGLFRILGEEKNIEPVYIMFTYDMLACLYTAKGESDKALMYALKTLKKMETTGDSAYAFTFYERIANIYNLMGQPSESIKWKKKALNTNIWLSYPELVFGQISRIVELSLSEGKAPEALKFIQEEVAKRKPADINDQRVVQKILGDCYNALKKYNLAEKCFLEMIRLGNEKNNKYPIHEKAHDNYRIGKFYFDLGNYNKARQFLEISLKNYEEYGALQNRKDGHFFLFRTDSLLGDYQGAIKHLQQSNLLKDSIFSIARNKQIEELQIVYQTEQKDKDFRLLEGKEKLGQVQLQNAKNFRNWIIAGASMLLIIAGLLYRQTVLRKKNNRIIQNKNEQLQHLVTEKEWLLKEVHHRVKNNLHTVIGLLESQAVYLQDDALKANEVSKHRIYAMSLVHQQLYKAEDIKTIDMAVYLPELLDYLSESFSTGRNIRFHRDIDPLKLGVSQAIPVALIVNEAVTNSIKYAFLPEKPGIISVSMRQSNDKINLVITDNGIGIDPAILKAESTSLGLKLMKGLSNDIDGEIHFVNENGMKIMVSFNPEPLIESTTPQVV